MKKTLTALAILGATGVLLLPAAPAAAQTTRTWVASNGDDAFPCSRVQPCKTFAGALFNTAINGIINCIDAGAYGQVTITKSVTIDCHEQSAGVLASLTTGVSINIVPGNPNDPLRTVRLRNLNIDGTGQQGTVGTRTGVNGVHIFSAAIVYIDDLQISDFSQRGIFDQRSTGGRLHINNTTVRNNAIAGIVVSPSSGSTRIDVDIERAIAVGNGIGMAFNNGAAVQMKRSVAANNTGSGIEATASTGSTTVHVDDTTVSNNGTGLLTNAAGTLRISNSDIALNGTRASGAWVSFGNNRGLGNTALGTLPTAAGGATGDLGQI